MKWWHKIIIGSIAIFIIAIFIKWWMTYEPMEVNVKNELNESVNVTLKVIGGFKNAEYFNQSFFIHSNESISFKNITNLAGEYYIVVKIGNNSVKKKIKFGKYFEKIEVIIKRNGILILNPRQ